MSTPRRSAPPPNRPALHPGVERAALRREFWQCAWHTGCAEPIWSSGGPIPLCETHAAELKKSDFDRITDLLVEIRADLKTPLARQG